jgi:predicted DCC family thiol-disulfide oxidoreductase YuxK
MTHLVIYDGNCNLCVSLVQRLEQLDRGQRFQYLPMQDPTGLDRYGITPQECELGMILLNLAQPAVRWQGSAAAEEISRLLSVGGLPIGNLLISAYRALPGLKQLGDRAYEQVRDHRYSWFGRRPTDAPQYPAPNCGDACDRAFPQP